MPKFSTYPTLFDECKALSISDLKRLKYLEPDQFRGGSIHWNSNGTRTGSISIRVSTSTGNSFVELDYKVNDKPIKYSIDLVSIPANLGKGIVWFFICPHTGKRCRKLHLVETYFYHRSAWKGCYYEKQIQSKRWRMLDKSILGRGFKLEAIYSKVYSKNFKTHYNNKPTRQFLNLAIKAQQFGDNELLNLL